MLYGMCVWLGFGALCAVATRARRISLVDCWRGRYASLGGIDLGARGCSCGGWTGCRRLHWTGREWGEIMWTTMAQLFVTRCGHLRWAGRSGTKRESCTVNCCTAAAPASGLVARRGARVAAANVSGRLCAACRSCCASAPPVAHSCCRPALGRAAGAATVRCCGAARAPQCAPFVAAQHWRGRAQSVRCSGARTMGSRAQPPVACPLRVARGSGGAR